MATEVKVPTLGESVTEASVGELLKNVGDAVAADEPIISLETDKVAVEAPSPVAGVIKEFKVAVGDTVEVEAVIAVIEEGAAPAAKGAEAGQGDVPGPVNPQNFSQAGNEISDVVADTRMAELPEIGQILTNLCIGQAQRAQHMARTPGPACASASQRKSNIAAI